MLNQALKDLIVRDLLPQVQTPGQYIGGELNAVTASGGIASAAPAKGAAASGTAGETAAPKFCAIDDPTCEACQ